MDINQWLDRYRQLEKREQLVLIGGGVFLVLFLLVVFIVMPLINQRAALTKAIAAKERQLAQVYELSAKVSALERVHRAGAGSQRGFTLFGFLEDLAKKQNVSERIEYMKPVTGGPNEQESVEVRIKGVYEEELIGLLYGIDTCPTPLKIRRLNLRRVDKDNNLDVTFQVVHG
ncbi:MAG TPA: type II secretion system protein GspM [Deltaproteobacteria bacterium]|nr:type II secretion system protein GspM [Deltaproteobacteria bacterium]